MQPEMPACVQNAMMKDKKPFTYTPGGIDLSQIKSPRMARRIERNANCEGVTNQPKVSPLAQVTSLFGVRRRLTLYLINGKYFFLLQQNGQQSAPGPRPVASSVGLPVQVFPTGPPPPPPAPMKSHLAPQPPAAPRPSPARSPQNFEPPPMGCRPEIKIPANPMAALRKVPKPEPKNDFWIEEYRKERSKSPMPGDGNTSREQSNAPGGPEETHIPEPVRQFSENKPQDTIDGSQGYTDYNAGQYADNRKSNPTQSPNDYRNPNSYSEKAPNNQNSYSTNYTNGTNGNTNDAGNNDRPINKPLLSQQDRINSPFTTASPTPSNLPKPLSPIKSAQEPDTQYYVRATQQQKPPHNAPNPVQNQWPPADAAQARVASSPARSINPTARVVSPPPRVMSPHARVMSPPPAQNSTNNARNVRLTQPLPFQLILIHFLSCSLNSGQSGIAVYSTQHTREPRIKQTAARQSSDTTVDGNTR